MKQLELFPGFRRASLPGVNLRFTARDQSRWFDRTEVIKRIGAANAKALGIAGYRVRRRARALLRTPRRKNISDLTPEELVNLRLAQQAKRNHGKIDPKEATVYRDGKVQILPWSALTKSERQKVRQIQWFKAKRAAQRPAQKASRPGEAPFSQTGRLKKHIQFALGEERTVVVIGPEILGGSDGVEALEYGGRVTMTGGRDKGKTINIEARPFMHPALERERQGIAELWKDRL